MAYGSKFRWLLANILISVLLITLAACSGNPKAGLSTDIAPTGGAYLPYGVPIPADQALTALPQPYDPKTMGPPSPDLTSNKNLATTPGFVPIPNPMWDEAKEKLGLSTTATANFHTNRGYYLKKTTAHPFVRVQANHDVQNNTVVPIPIATQNPVIYYAPTLMPAGGSCIESTTIHRRTTTDPNAPVEDLHAFWNWCISNPNFTVIKNTNDATVKNHYVRTYNGEEFLVTYIHQDPANGCWGGGLYDYSVGKYSQLIYSCGTNQGGYTNGWTMWETYNVQQNNSGSNCPSTASIKAADIKVGTKGQPSDTRFDLYTDTYSTLNLNNPCFTNGVYGFVKPAPGFASNSWQANTLH